MKSFLAKKRKEKLTRGSLTTEEITSKRSLGSKRAKTNNGDERNTWMEIGKRRENRYCPISGRKPMISTN